MSYDYYENGYQRFLLTIGLMVITALVIIAGMAFNYLVSTEAFPRCPEDAVIIGVGNFEGGRWDHYQCGPARDDLRLP